MVLYIFYVWILKNKGWIIKYYDYELIMIFNNNVYLLNVLNVNWIDLMFISFCLNNYYGELFLKRNDCYYRLLNGWWNGRMVNFFLNING